MLSWFASDFFARSPVLLAPLLAMGIFGTVFVCFSLRALFLSKSEIRALHHMPLLDDEGDAGVLATGCEPNVREQRGAL